MWSFYIPLVWRSVCRCESLRKPRTIGELSFCTHAVPSGSYVDLSGCIPFGSECDLCVRDLEIAKLTFDERLVFILPHVTVLVLELLTLTINERGFGFKL